MDNQNNLHTKYWDIKQETNLSHHASIKEAAELLKKKQVVAFPTETVYGLGADATDEKAVEKIFQAKGRPADNPLIVHVADIKQIEELVKEIPTVARTLFQHFLPGPLTLIFESNGKSAKNVTAGLSTVAIRVPDHPVAQALLQEANVPIAAPSANRSGRPSPTTAQHVFHDLNGRIAGILDGGPTGVGVESTVLDCTGEIPIILRPGGVTKEQIEEVIGETIDAHGLTNEKDKPRSPGMKYTHYAPDAPLWLVKGDIEFLQNKINEAKKEGLRVGAMLSKEHVTWIEADVKKDCGSQLQLGEVAAKLYDTLRSFNEEKIDVIIAETYSEAGVGQAIMNRLKKAASKFIQQNH